MAEPTIEDYLIESRTFAPSAAFRAQALVVGSLALRRGRRRSGGLLGPSGPRAGQLVPRLRRAARSGSCPSPSGSWAARSTSPTTASTATSRPGGATRSPTTGRASPATPAPSPTPSSHAEVCRFANVLRSLGVERGDRVGIYMPMIPELPIAMLACTRIGAAHSCIFGGFSPDSIIDRVNDAEAKVIVTADGGFRRGAPALLKPAVDEAVGSTPSVTAVVVVQRVTGHAGVARGHRVDDGGGARPLVPRPHGRRLDRLPARAHGQRGPALPALHLGHHGQAQGHHAHHRRLPHPGGVQPQVRVRPASRRRRLLVRGRHRLGHRPQLHRVRAARPTVPPRSSTRAHPTRPAATGSGRSSSATA